MGPEKNGNTETPNNGYSGYVLVRDILKSYVSEQVKKRQLTEADILNECIQFHMQNAGT